MQFQRRDHPLFFLLAQDTWQHSLSGFQSLLVWSWNYIVLIYGVIKFFVMGDKVQGDGLLSYGDGWLS